MRYAIALLCGLLLSIPLWGWLGDSDGATDQGYGPRTTVVVTPPQGGPQPDYPDPVFTPVPAPPIPQMGQPEEDEPGWNCVTMGNRDCG